MFRKTITLTLIITTFFTLSSLQAVYQPNYAYIGEGNVIAISSRCDARTLILENGMVFEITPGSSKWIGSKATIYRDVTGNPSSNYILKLKNYEFQATKQEPYIPVPPPLPAPCLR